MTLAIFDLDNTLLTGDSNQSWGEFLVAKNLVERNVYQATCQKFHDQYKQGTLDIHEYLKFSFKPLCNHSMTELAILHNDFMDNIIRPMIGDKAKELVAFHKEQGHILLVITATNSFVAQPIVTAFGIDNLLATELKITSNRYVNEIVGLPCFQEGKVTRLRLWLKKNNHSLSGSFFYTDSHNDIPLLEMVDTPVAVDPDEKLRNIASEKGWNMISLTP